MRLSKNLAEDVWDRAAGGVCGGQKAHRAFNQQAFETFLNVSKAAQRGENTFSTRWLAGIAGALGRIIAVHPVGARMARPCREAAGAYPAA